MILEAAADWGLSERPRASAAARLAARRYRGRESPPVLPPPSGPPGLGRGRAAKPTGSEVLRSQLHHSALLMLPPAHGGHPDEANRGGGGGAPVCCRRPQRAGLQAGRGKQGRAGAAMSRGTIPALPFGAAGRSRSLAAVPDLGWCLGWLPGAQLKLKLHWASTGRQIVTVTLRQACQGSPLGTAPGDGEQRVALGKGVGMLSDAQAETGESGHAPHTGRHPDAGSGSSAPTCELLAQRPHEGPSDHLGPHQDDLRQVLGLRGHPAVTAPPRTLSPAGSFASSPPLGPCPAPAPAPGAL